jgi:hypothetical protein
VKTVKLQLYVSSLDTRVGRFDDRVDEDSEVDGGRWKGAAGDKGRSTDTSSPTSNYDFIALPVLL